MMKGSLNRRSLVTRLLLLAAAAASVPALVISIAQQSISSHALEASIEREQMQLARRLAEEVNGQIHEAQSLVALVARSSFFSAGSRVDQYEALRNLLQEAPFQEAMFISSAGEELVKVALRGTRPAATRRGIEVSQPYIGPAFFSGNRAPTILISEPVRTFANPTRSGAVMAKLSFTKMNDLMRESRVGERGVPFVVTEKGMLLAHPDIQKVLQHTNLASLPVVQTWQKASDQPTRLQEYENGNKEAMMALAYPIPLLKSAVIVEQPRREVYATLLRMRYQFLVWTLVSLLVFMAFAVVVGWRILQPLRQLQTAAEQVGRGEMDVKLDIRTDDELEDLGQTFEAMARSLSELEHMRRDLISMIVHDLKMPLATILPSLESLIAGDFGKLTGPQTNFLQLARRSGQEMLNLIQNLLDVARMEEGKLSLQKDLIAPGDWAQGVVENFQPLAEAGKKHLSLVIGEDLAPLEGDVGMLTRVLGNLISNAMRYTAPGSGEVVVTIYREGSTLAVQVRDNGEGIPEEDQKRIFEKFVQGAGQKIPMRTGSGLGLTFCKMVVEAHGGRISVYSAPREGSLFTLHLPLHLPPPLPQEKTPELAANSTD